MKKTNEINKRQLKFREINC